MQKGSYIVGNFICSNYIESTFTLIDKKLWDPLFKHGSMCALPKKEGFTQQTVYEKRFLVLIQYSCGNYYFLGSIRKTGPENKIM